MISLDPLLELLAPKPANFPHTWLRDVKGAAEYAQIRPDALPLPAGWVVRAGERSKHLGERAEELTIVFDLVLAIGNMREHKDRAETDNQMLAYRRVAKARLLGIEVAGESGVKHKPIKFTGGRILQITDRDMYWADRYEFTTTITNYLPDPPLFEGVFYKENLP